MDPRTTLEQMNVERIAGLYFTSLNDQHTTKLHIVESRRASTEEIETDVKAWWAGFAACAKLLVGDGAQLPVLESITTQITKQFPEKAKLAA